MVWSTQCHKFYCLFVIAYVPLWFHTFTEPKQCPMILSSILDKKGKNHLHFTHFFFSSLKPHKQNQMKTHFQWFEPVGDLCETMTLISILKWQITSTYSIPRKAHFICSSLICVNWICMWCLYWYPVDLINNRIFNGIYQFYSAHPEDFVYTEKKNGDGGLEFLSYNVDSCFILGYFLR